MEYSQVLIPESALLLSSENGGTTIVIRHNVKMAASTFFMMQNLLKYICVPLEPVCTDPRRTLFINKFNYYTIIKCKSTKNYNVYRKK